LSGRGKTFFQNQIKIFHKTQPPPNQFLKVCVYLQQGPIWRVANKRCDPNFTQTLHFKNFLFDI